LVVRGEVGDHRRKLRRGGDRLCGCTPSRADAAATLHLARQARDAPTAEAPAIFVPAVVEAAPSEPTAVVTPPRRARRRSKLSGIELEIGGVEIRVGADAPPRTIAAVIRALKAGS
jgi:transposase